ncbi:hypothetical protein BC828DRAFT_438915 [Blastocladiella britannica]|nr:hypothetical protein BC828DRAFT_438915 [Blastocladiella britannica]
MEAVAFAIGLHTAAITSLGICIYKTVRKRHARDGSTAKRWRIGTWTGFWVLVVLTCLSLMITSSFEITISTLYIIGFPVPYTPMHTLGGDISCRLGMLGMLTSRMYRLTLSVDKAYVRRAMVVQGIATVGLLTSLALTTWLRINEYKRMDPVTSYVFPDPEIQAMRNTDDLVTFVVFFIMIVISLGGDVAFNLVVLHSSPRVGVHLTRRQIFNNVLVYIPSAVVNTAYLIIVCSARAIADTDYVTWGLLQYLSITLSRFAPSLEMVTFLTFSIPQTKTLLRRNRPFKSSIDIKPSSSRSAKATPIHAAQPILASATVGGTSSQGVHKECSEDRLQ